MTAQTAAHPPLARKARHPYRAALATVRVRTGLTLVGLVVLAGLLAPLLAGHGPTDQSGLALAPPGTPGHPLGTDDLGRDLLARRSSRPSGRPDGCACSTCRS